MYGGREGKGGGLNVSRPNIKITASLMTTFHGQRNSHGQTQTKKAEKSTPKRGITKSYTQSTQREEGCRNETTHAINAMHLMKTQD